MFLIPVTLIAIVLVIFYKWLKNHYSYWEYRNVPHEKPTFFLGNMKGLGEKYHWRDINSRIYKRFKRSAPIIGFYTFLNRAAFITDLDLIKQILIKDFNSFTDRGLFHNERDDPLTANLLFIDGEKWRVMRHKVTPIFTTGKMKYMFPTMVAVGKRLVEHLNELITTKNDDIEIKDLSARYTTDIIGSCAFGIECNSLSDPNAEFRQMGRRVFEEPRHHILIQAFMFMQPELARKLRMKNFLDETSDFFINAVRETIEYRQKNNVKRNDLMDILVELKAKRDEMGDGGNENDLTNGLTVVQVAAQAMAFFLAGFETSSTLMSFCIYELALNTEIQQKLRTNILEVLKKYNGEITYENIKEMTYLEMVISETLRLHSVLPHTTRIAMTDYKIPDTRYVLEKGTRILIPVDAIHMDPEFYPEPEKFNPERFSAEEIAKRHPCAYLPFGDGPRNCIGMRFGKMQAQIGLISLLSNFTFTVTEKTQIPIQISKKTFLIMPEKGVHVKVETI